MQIEMTYPELLHMRNVLDMRLTDLEFRRSKYRRYQTTDFNRGSYEEKLSLIESQMDACNDIRKKIASAIAVSMLENDK